MAIATALTSALLYAVASVLQHHSASTMPTEKSMRVGLLVALAARPLWMLGILADIGAYAAQFVALGHGSLVLVQPLLVTGLLFALPIGAAVSHRRLSMGEWAAAAAVVVGLAVFLVVASPGSGHDDATSAAWGVTAGAVMGPVSLIVVVAIRRQGASRATLLAAAAGGVMGLAAALTKAVAHQLGIGVGHALGSWETYGLLACAGLGLLLVQSAFQAGPLRWSLPMLTVTETVVGIVIGAVLLAETISSAPEDIVLELVSLGVMAAGVFALGKSPLVAAVD
jgi:drug/metabolite transporter (DMT)-like permease